MNPELAALCLFLFSRLRPDELAPLADAVLAQIGTIRTRDGSPVPPDVAAIQARAARALEALRGGEGIILAPATALPPRGRS